MNREQMIEKAARKVWDENEAEYWGDDPYRTPFDPSQPDEDGEMTAAEWLQTVTRIVDAILPQVATIEELADLPVGTLLKGDDGDVWLRCMNGCDCLSETGEGGAYPLSKTWDRGPLTVIWTPS